MSIHQQISYLSSPLEAAYGDLSVAMASTNFEFLREKHPELADLGSFAELYAFTDQDSALVKLRVFAETLVQAIYSYRRFEQLPTDSLVDLLGRSSFKAATPPLIQNKFHLLRKKGNQAAHGDLQQHTTEKVLEFVREAHGLALWWLLSSGQGKAGELPVWKEPAPPESVDELKAKSAATERALLERELQLEKLLADLEAARAKAEAKESSEQELHAMLASAQHAADVLEFSEEETRAKIIDESLRSVGWDVGLNGADTAEVKQEFLLNDGTKADYVLFDPETGKPLAVIEAKKTAEDPDKGKIQARIYADRLEEQFGQRPVIFYTNGFEIFIWEDAKTEPPRSLYNFYSRDSLEYAIWQTSNREPELAALNPSEAIVPGRLYQKEAIKRVAAAFDQRKRNALVIQATGTGKTRVAIGICELMARAKWAKRILFLCDRRELRKQANDAFAEHFPDASRVIVSRATAKDRDKRVYLATYPAMMKCFQDFDPGFFDLVIADESHRSIYNRYRDLFRWFDSFQVGLTATPIQFIERNTYELFGCEDQDPTFNYDYAEAVEADYLCPFQVIEHTTKFLRGGMKYSEMNAAQKAQADEQSANSEAIDYEKEEVDRKVFNKDTDRHILENLMKNGLRNADGTRLGKTIIFARNHKHAKLLVSLFDELYPQYGGDFCLRIDNYEPRAEQLIDDFKSKDGSKNLTIAVSVDMLDTGIDVPEIVNLVFAKPVKSHAKFWQMIGRGTRLCKNLFGPGQDKTEFLIFDHWGNFEYFEEAQTERQPTRSKSLTELLFEKRIDLAQAAVDQQDFDALPLATGLLRADVAALPDACLAVRDRLREVKSMEKPDVIQDFAPTTRAILRDVIAPLMQWRDLQGKEDAYRFDLFIARLQHAQLVGSADAADFRDTIIEMVSALPANLKVVQDHRQTIEAVKQPGHLAACSVVELETIREELRGLMHLRKKTTYTPTEPEYLNIAEDPGEVQYAPRAVTLPGGMEAYKERVGALFTELLQTNAALQKIRSAQPVTESELEDLAAEILLRDPDIDLQDLVARFPNKAGSLALAIRQIVGLDAEAVRAHFEAFATAHPDLNANQLRFLKLLEGQVAAHGAIELKRLWDAPFTSIHTDGIAGVFPDTAQVTELIDFVKTINDAN